MSIFTEQRTCHELAKDPEGNIERLDAACVESKERFRQYLEEGSSGTSFLVDPHATGKSTAPIDSPVGAEGTAISKNNHSSFEADPQGATLRPTDLVTPSSRRENIGTCVHPSGVIFDVHEVTYAPGTLVGLPDGDIPLNPTIIRALPVDSAFSDVADAENQQTERILSSQVTASLRGPGMPPQVLPSALALRRALSTTKRFGGRHLKPMYPGRTGYTPPPTPGSQPSICRVEVRGEPPSNVPASSDTNIVAGRGLRTKPPRRSTKPQAGTQGFLLTAKSARQRDTTIPTDLRENLMQASIANAMMKLKAVDSRAAVNQASMKDQMIGDMTKNCAKVIKSIQREIAEGLGKDYKVGVHEPEI